MTAVHPNVEVAGIVITMECPSVNHRMTHDVPDGQQLIDSLEAIPTSGVRLREFVGPLINGLYVATFEMTGKIPVNAAVLRMDCYRIFSNLLRPVEDQI